MCLFCKAVTPQVQLAFPHSKPQTCIYVPLLPPLRSQELSLSVDLNLSISCLCNLKCLIFLHLKYFAMQLFKSIRKKNVNKVATTKSFDPLGLFYSNHKLLFAPALTLSWGSLSCVQLLPLFGICSVFVPVSSNAFLFSFCPSTLCFPQTTVKT